MKHEHKLPTSDSETLSRRLLWVLFTDTSTRFSTLAEECAYLHTTVQNLRHTFLREEEKISQKNEKEFSHPIEKSGLSSNNEGNYRSISANSIRSQYRVFKSREKALVSLERYLGGLVFAIRENQKSLRQSFESLIISNVIPADKMFWFIAERDYALSTLFPEYTAQLEHAHEKIIQMVEQQPGATPHPLLLRRWHSSTHGDFLSVYSRHINWEVHTFLGKVFGFHDVSKLPPHMIHSWTHVASSMARPHRIKFERGKYSVHFSAIESAFFYMEMPILLPLLYHECAHLSLASLRATPLGFCVKTAKEQLENKLNEKLPQHELFWREWFEEIVADSIAITLGGTAYLAALVAQLFGLYGGSFFSREDLLSDHMLDKGAILALNDVGKSCYREYNYGSGITAAERFWEARLRIGVSVFQYVYADELKSTGKHPASEWLTSVTQLIDLQEKAAVKAYEYSEHQASEWANRSAFSNRLAENVLEILDPFLRKFEPCKKLTKALALPESLLSLLKRKAEGMEQLIFGGEANAVRSYYPENSCRLDQVSFVTKWAFSSRAVAKLRESKDVSIWTNSYSRYIRNDGGVAFRLALEWFLARDSFAIEWADDIDSRVAGEMQADDLSRYRGTIDRNIRTTRMLSVGDTKTLIEWLRMRKYAENIEDAQSNIDIKGVSSRALEETIEVRSEQIVESLKKALTSNETCEVRVGTFLIGSFKRACLRSGEKLSYKMLLDKAREYYCEVVKGVNVRIEGLGNGAGEEGQGEGLKGEQYSYPDPKFFPLIGEYDFAVFLGRITPTEEWYHPEAEVAFLDKRRCVIAVYEDSQPESTVTMRGISLVRLNHRHTWDKVVKHVKGRVDDKKDGLVEAQIFLSSGWEDLIVVFGFANDQEFWETFDTIGLGLEVECDVSQTHVSPVLTEWERAPQSATVRQEEDGSMAEGSAMSPMINASQTQGLGSSVGDEETHNRRTKIAVTRFQKNIRTLKNGNFIDSVFERTGRYDYRIIWQYPEVAHENFWSQRLPQIIEVLDGSFLTGVKNMNFCFIKEFSTETSQTGVDARCAVPRLISDLALNLDVEIDDDADADADADS